MKWRDEIEEVYNKAFSKTLHPSYNQNQKRLTKRKCQTDTLIPITTYNPGLKTPVDVEIHILDVIHAHLSSQKEAGKLRDLIEKNCIMRLRTFAPYGVNILDVEKL